ncbi:MAG: AAA family ATPase [Isosphaeraceae bacterium]
MITRVEVSNFRSIGERADLRLGRLTALVGPNGSGKSNFADALQFIAESLKLGLEAAITKRHGIASIGRWNAAGRPFDVRIRIDSEEEDGLRGLYILELGATRSDSYRVKRELAAYGPYLDGAGWDKNKASWFEIVEGRWNLKPRDLHPKVDSLGLVLPLVAADERFEPLAETLRQSSIYSIFPNALREPQRPDPVKPMTEHGGNWCSILKHMRQEAWSNELSTALGQITGDIDDVRVNQIGGYLVAEFRHGTVPSSRGVPEQQKWFDAAQESDGTLRIAGILTALLQEPPLTLIGIEEPELTIHPGAIPLLYDYILEASRRSQVLLTTHSPDLLSLLDADDVRVVERRDGVTSVSRMEESQREAVRDRLLTLGDLMRMEGLRQETEPQPSPVGD